MERLSVTRLIEAVHQMQRPGGRILRSDCWSINYCRVISKFSNACENLEDSYDAMSMVTKRLDTSSFMSADDATIREPERLVTTVAPVIGTDSMNFAFDDDLQNSRVYQWVKNHGCDYSLISSAVRTQSWSIFSGISLSEISLLSVIALPLELSDLQGHHDHYPLTCEDHREVYDLDLDDDHSWLNQWFRNESYHSYDTIAFSDRCKICTIDLKEQGCGYPRIGQEILCVSCYKIWRTQRNEGKEGEILYGPDSPGTSQENCIIAEAQVLILSGGIRYEIKTVWI